VRRRNDPYLFATQHGEQIVRDHKLSLPVDPVALAEDLGITVTPKPASAGGVSGMFIRVGDFYGIAYATHIDNEGFKRFSVAHELGHYFLPGHVDAVFRDADIHESRAGFVSGDRYELEADNFAAGLLMPRRLFTPLLRRAGDGIAAVENLAAACQTSLTSTAIRYTQCSSEPVAIVVSAGGSIDYCFMSDALRDFDDIDWIRKRQALPRTSATFAFNQDPARVRRADRVEAESDLQLWFGGSRSIELREDVSGLGSYGKTLTVLHGIEPPDEAEDDDEALIESWTPRLGRR
jgi:Zn-dependent peptidase ImmA (M78 family)